MLNLKNYCAFTIAAMTIQLAFAQAPSISYSSNSFTYNVETAITPQTPTNTGGTQYSFGQTMTIAGSGASGAINGTGTAATFNEPLSVGVDALGNVYVADEGNNQIRMITPGGAVTTFAGHLLMGFQNGVGTAAAFYHPATIFLDPIGNIYVGDQYNNCIRTITPGGVVSTRAGRGDVGAFNSSLALQSTFNKPYATTMDANGNLYVADYSNHLIRKIPPSGSVSTFAGSGTASFVDGNGTAAGFNSPAGIVIDNTGNMFVLDRANHAVRKITPSGYVSTFAGNGTAGFADGIGTIARFNYPTGLAIDQANNLYIADQSNQRIRMITPGGAVTTIAGNATAGAAEGIGAGAAFNSPYGLTVDLQNNLIIADEGNNKIRKIITAPFSITPSLPGGLTFDPLSGTISGTPGASSAAKTYTVTTANSSGTSSTTISITINGTTGINPNRDQNFIITYVPRITNITSTSVLNSSVSDKSKIQSGIQYFDGLGRPMQQILVKGSPTGRDIVQITIYDQVGREANKLLPYTVAPASSSDGSYKPAAFTDQAAFYLNPGGASWGAPGISKITFPVSETSLETSPLSRIIEQGAVGDPWQLAGKTGASNPGHTVKMDYATNDATSLTGGSGRWARRYDVSLDANGKPSLVDKGSYVLNRLNVTIGKDENWTSGDGKVGTIEQYKDKRGNILVKRIFNTSGQIISTYYIYDDFGNLIFVLPPKALPDNGSVSQATLDLLCYQYRFDERHRLVEKKLPGMGREYIVYNKLNLAVATQDSLQRVTNKWTCIKYDVMGRSIISGVWDNGNTPVSRLALQSTVSSQSTLWETRSNSSSTTYYYSSAAFPSSGVTQYLTVNYYNDYNLPNLPGAYNAASSYSPMTTGMVTASLTNVLNTSDLLWSVQYYDDLGRTAKTYLQHYLGGTIDLGNYDEIVRSYDFANEDTLTTRTHHTVANPVLTITNSYTYDHVGRRTNVWETINGATKVLLSKTDYNQIGQLYVKHLYSKNSGTSYLQHITYKYNERGWLNKDSSALFVMQLKYNDGTTPQYNGNIANQLWGTGSSLSKSYAYAYDKLSRLSSGTSNEGFNEKTITYDQMGNILTLTRNSPSSTTTNFTYNYNGNQVTTITGVSASAYQYDGNGNVSYDPHNNVSISYNQLNLPQTISGSKSINYLYDASGHKLRRVSANSSVGTVDYISGIQYQDGIVESIATEDGRARRKADGSYSYEFTLYDHLGNSRVCFDDSSSFARVIQRDDYYPFGLEISRYVSGVKNKNLFNGKELQEETGLYDFGARFYDPLIARMNMIDPMAEKYAGISPYSFAGNNPIKHMDPDGKDIIFTIKRNKKGKIVGVTISSTIYITGPGSSKKRAADLTSYARSHLPSGQSNGVNISFNIQYVYSPSKSKEDLREGEGLFIFHAEAEMSGPDKTKTRSGGIGEDGMTPKVFNVYSSGADSWTILHETLHEIGLSDRYDDHREYYAGDASRFETFSHTHLGFKGDILGTDHRMRFNASYYQYYYTAINSLLDAFTLSPIVQSSSYFNIVTGTQVTNIPYSQFVDKIRIGDHYLILTDHEPGRTTHLKRLGDDAPGESH